MENQPVEEKKVISEEDAGKIQWIMQLFGFIKALQREIEKKEKNKRYFSIFVSGCITYFITEILYVFLQTESIVIVFFSAFVSLCLHYIIDNIEKAWDKVISLKKFQKQLMALEKERIKLNIKEEALDFGPYADEDDGDKK